MRKCIGSIVIEDDGSRYAGMLITKENVDRFIFHVKTMLSELEPNNCIADGYKAELKELQRIKLLI